VREQEARSGHVAVLLLQCYFEQRAIEIVSGSDQAEMGESIGKVAERFLTIPEREINNF